MPTRKSARPSGRARLAVSVATPDGATGATRGLAGWLAKAAPARARGTLTVAIVSDGRMRTLNRTFRGKNAATDVLSFPAAGPTPGDESYLGDIVIASGVAARQAEAAGHALTTEVKVLALHGLLHLLGHDHETDEGEMARLESRLRRKAGLKDGLIARHRR